MIDKWLSKTKFKEGYEKVVRKIFLGISSVYAELTITFIVSSMVFTIISFLIDTLDGSVARFEGPTIFGGILDIFCDRLVEVSIIIAIVATDLSNLVLPGMFTLAATILCISMFLIVGGIIKRDELDKKSKVIRYQGGLMERSETFFFLLAAIILIPWRSVVLWVFALLVFLTALLRLKKYFKA